MKSRQITGIVIHCSATPNGRWHDVRDIDLWHQHRGFKRDEAFRHRHNPTLHAIGYHFVIYTNGCIATGRHLNEVGAHAGGFNSKSIGICMVGADRFYREQWLMLRDNVLLLQRDHPQARVVGHRDLPKVKKSCPGFSVADWLAGGMEPLAGHILENSS